MLKLFLMIKIMVKLLCKLFYVFIDQCDSYLPVVAGIPVFLKLVGDISYILLYHQKGDEKSKAN